MPTNPIPIPRVQSWREVDEWRRKMSRWENSKVAASANASLSTVAITSDIEVDAREVIDELVTDMGTLVTNLNSAITSLNDLKTKMRNAGIMET